MSEVHSVYTVSDVQILEEAFVSVEESSYSWSPHAHLISFFSAACSSLVTVGLEGVV